MPDEKTTPTPAEDEPTLVATAVVSDDTGVQAAGGIAVQGDAALIVAKFADMDAAKATYEALKNAERDRSIDIDGVLVVNADAQGKIHVQKMTDHTTRNGFAWGAVAGVVLGDLPAQHPRQRGSGRYRRSCHRQDRQRDQEGRRGRRARDDAHARIVGHRRPRSAARCRDRQGPDAQGDRRDLGPGERRDSRRDQGSRRSC